MQTPMILKLFDKKIKFELLRRDLKFLKKPFDVITVKNKQKWYMSEVGVMTYALRFMDASLLKK